MSNRSVNIEGLNLEGLTIARVCEALAAVQIDVQDDGQDPAMGLAQFEGHRSLGEALAGEFWTEFEAASLRAAVESLQPKSVTLDLDNLAVAAREVANVLHNLEGIQSPEAVNNRNMLRSALARIGREVPDWRKLDEQQHVATSRGLEAKSNPIDGWYVVDNDGGRWWPTADAMRIIARSDDPATTAVAMCIETPMAGQWHQ